MTPTISLEEANKKFTEGQTVWVWNYLDAELNEGAIIGDPRPSKTFGSTIRVQVYKLDLSARIPCIRVATNEAEKIFLTIKHTGRGPRRRP